jgi:perosamine synthetase
MVTLGIGPGDEVIIPNVTFAACANSVIHSGATPVFCEINETFCIDIEQCEKLITKNTKAIMLVHLYGKMADVQGARKLALKYGLKIIEDCAEALGSKWQCERAGTFGDAATFSFFGNKTITTGEGGMILFKAQKDYEKAKILRDHGMNPQLRYWHEQVGFNYRMTNLQAAIGLAQLSKLDQIIDRKVQIMDQYNQNLKYNDKVVYRPVARKSEINSNWIYTIRFSSEIDITTLSAKLEANGIQTRRVFYPLSDMPIYKSFPKSANLKNSRSFSEQGLCLPTSLHLKDDQIDYICDQLESLLDDTSA